MEVVGFSKLGQVRYWKKYRVAGCVQVGVLKYMIRYFGVSILRSDISG